MWPVEWEIKGEKEGETGDRERERKKGRKIENNTPHTKSGNRKLSSI